jgi:hypothetical protein
MVDFGILEITGNFQFDLFERIDVLGIVLLTESALCSGFFVPFQQIDLKGSNKYFVWIRILKFELIISVDFSHDLVLFMYWKTDLQINRIFW